MPVPFRFIATMVLALTFVLFAWLSTANAASQTPNVVVTIRPVHALVTAVMKDVAIPHLLVRGTTSPHDYKLRPSDAAALQKADMIFWIGPGLETMLKGRLKTVAPKAKKIRLDKVPGITRRKFRETDHDHAGHDHHGDDPHIWLDPNNAIAIIKHASTKLSKIDPENAEKFDANAREAIKDIRMTSKIIADLLATEKGKSFLVYHDAFQHFEKRFGVVSSGAISLGDGRRPGARHMAELRKHVKKDNITCVLMEPGANSQSVDALSAATPMKKVSIDPLGSAIPSGPQLYTQLLLETAKAIKSCLS